MRAAFVAIIVASTSAGCVFMRVPDEPDGGVGQGQPAGDGGGHVVAGTDAGSSTPGPSVTISEIPAPEPDEPAACRGIGTAPDLEPAPDRPCTEETSERMTAFQYAAGRIVYRSD